ncbi:sulfotransferase family protein [Streptomyces sp. NPDC088260]|uniref:sulfotransferase family protein n=1 Tax=Streptomyces sp. NPDC088260 TaxID=3365850 RepID=UPI0038141C0B
MSISSGGTQMPDKSVFALMRDSGKPETGLEPESRLVESPVFIMSLMRSGSTLLRCVLDTHPLIHSPHELHLSGLGVRFEKGELTRLSARKLGLKLADLKYLLWDSLLHRQLRQSGKRIIVEKTPANIFIHEELACCWPLARYIFLRRHPADMVKSLVTTGICDSKDAAVNLVIEWAEQLDAALDATDRSVVVRYEDLTNEPEKTCRQLTAFLDVPFDSRMLEYGNVNHGALDAGVGDWGENIHSGRIKKVTEYRRERPAEGVIEICERWGYTW